MLTSANVMFLSCKEESFKGKNGDDLHFQKVTFIADDDDNAMSLTALKDLDFSDCNRCDQVQLDINFTTDPRTGYLRGKIVAFQR